MGRTSVFDSNVWVMGFTGEHEAAAALVREVERGELTVAVDDYVFEEVFTAFDRELDGAVESRTKANFATTVPGWEAVTVQSDGLLGSVDLSAVRDAAETRLIGGLVGCEPKDAPIAVLAFDAGDRESTLYTMDRPFHRAVVDEPVPEVDARFLPQ